MAAEIIVSGASGHLGRMVLKFLTETHKVDPAKIIAVTRKVDHLSEWQQKGVDVRKGDFDDPDSLKTAFKGGKRMLIIAPDTFGPKRLQQHENAIREAVAAGVKHIAFTGQVTPPPGTTPTGADYPETENILKNTPGITYTILGWNFWMETLIEFYAPAIASGTFYTSSAAGKAAHISREDFARACAAAMASESTTNAKFELTGPESLDRRQVIDTINKVLGLAIQIVEVPQSELLGKLKEQITDEMLAEFVAFFEGKFAEGLYEKVGTGYHELTGQQPEKFSDLLERNKEKYTPKK